MVRKLLNSVLAIAVIIFAVGMTINAQTNLTGRYVYMFSNTTDEGGAVLILAEKNVAIWKYIEDGEERRYERKGIWKSDENQKTLTIDFQKDQSRRDDITSEAFQINFAVSEDALTVKTSDLPGIKADEAVFKKK